MFTKFASLMLAGVFVLTCFILYPSCNKKEDNVIIPVIPVDLDTKVTTSVSGFITDENNNPVAGSMVQAGSQSTVSDQFGYFSIKDVSLVKNAAVVTISKTGYFKATKTYIAAENKSAFFRIKLLPKNTVGSFDGVAGGDVSLPNGMTVTMPSNSVVNAATKTVYTGSVNVAIHFLDPTSNDITATMPGDLRGLDDKDQIKLLSSFGMAAVELFGSAGELLQIAEGKSATLSFPIPSGLQVAAPASIPLWYFDESKGVWKQEGSASKSGNKYTASVSHFSFWNCDIPADYVILDLTVKNTGGDVLPNVFVKVYPTSTPSSYTGGWTDSTGFVSGPVPDNSRLTVEVFSDNSCLVPYYKSEITTAGNNLSMGDISVTSSNMATIHGSVVDCNNSAVSKGCVIIKDDYQYKRAIVTNGSFSFVQNLCTNTNGFIKVIAVDYGGGQQGKEQPINYVVGDNNVGTISACGISSTEFLNYTINGTAYSFVTPPDTLRSIMTFYPQIDALSGNGPFRHFYFNLTETPKIGENAFVYFMIRQPSSGINMFSSFQDFGNTPIHITEYDTNSGFIAGNFSGTFRNFSPGVNDSLISTIDTLPYKITCNFRIRL